MTIEGVYFKGQAGVTASQPLSPDLTWEKTEQYDLGLDMDMFDYRLNLKLDYYYKKTTSLIYGVPLPSGLYPFTSRTENAMDVSNEGLELELKADILRNGPVSWRMKFNAARNWNRFEKSYNNKDVDGLIIGQPLYQMRVQKCEGFYNSEDEVPKYYSTSGQETYWGGISTKSNASGQLGYYKLIDFNGDYYADYYCAGSTLPLFHGGWVNELMWKNFDLNILFNYVVGRKMINAKDANSFDVYSSKPKFFDYREVAFWSEDNHDANMPALGNTLLYLLDTKIEKVSYVSLKQLTLGYNLPKQLMRKAGLGGLRLFATVENLFYLSDYSGGNPETIDVYGGIDKGTDYPLPRKWTLGLTLNF